MASLCSGPVWSILFGWLASGIAVGQDTAEPPTWHEQIGPLLQKHCADCHRPGEPAPFSLLTYDDAFKRRRLIRSVTESGYMPPWLPTSHGLPLKGARRLAKTEIEQIAAWVAAGAPAGAEPERPEASTSSSSDDGQAGREPDLLLRGEQIVVPPTGPDQFRNLLIPVPTEQLRFVAEVQIRPGNPAVHHAILASDPSRGGRALDAADEGPGFEGMSIGTASIPDGHFIGWTPGKSPSVSPDGMAWRLLPGSDLLLQLHLTPTGKPERVQPEVAIWFTDQRPAQRPFAIELFQEEIDIPAGAEAHRIVDDYRVPVDVTLLRFYPHAHYLAHRMRATLKTPDGKATTIFTIDAWNFDWQDDYTLAEPLAIPAGSTVRMEYEFDNSAANLNNPSSPPVRVRFGEKSTDEMATLGLMVVPTAPSGHLPLRVNHLHRVLQKRGEDSASLRELADLARGAGQLQVARGYVRRALAVEPRDADALTSLARILAAEGATDKARELLSMLAEGAPDHAQARLEYGRILAGTGDLQGAVPHLRKALELRPSWVDAHSLLGTVLAQSGAPQEALPHALFVARQLAGDPNAHNNLAGVLMTLGRLEEARAAGERAVAIAPNFLFARLNLVRCLCAMGELPAAEQQLAAAARIQPDHPGVTAERATLEAAKAGARRRR